MTIRNRVEPKPLPKVKDMHLAGVFGQFEDVIDDAVARLEGSGNANDAEKARFFRYLKQRVDAEQFGRMQEFLLCDSRLDLSVDMVKYIDPIVWFESKLAIAQRVGLDKRAPTEILDLGTGPCHFPVVAEFYGHTVVGADLPYRVTGDMESGHLYDALGAIYNVRRIPLKVETLKRLRPLERRYGLVTAFLAAFNIDAEKKPWDIGMWKFFLNDLHHNVMAPGGELIMSLTHNKLSDDVWDYLTAHADFADDKSRQIHIPDLAPYA